MAPSKSDDKKANQEAAMGLQDDDSEGEDELITRILQERSQLAAPDNVSGVTSVTASKAAMKAPAEVTMVKAKRPPVGPASRNGHRRVARAPSAPATEEETNEEIRLLQTIVQTRLGEEKGTSEKDTITPPVDLERTSTEGSMSLSSAPAGPGAYRVVPGEDSMHVSAASFSSVGSSAHSTGTDATSSSNTSQPAVSTPPIPNMLRATSEASMSVAYSVDDEFDNIPQAVPVDAVSGHARVPTKLLGQSRGAGASKGLYVGLLLVAAVVATAAITTTILLTRKSSSGTEGEEVGDSIMTSDPSSAVTLEPTISPLLLGLDLPNYTLQALQDPSSPQSMAYQWLVGDPSLASTNSISNTYTRARLEQRFALATFFYSTGGPNWKFSNSWLDYDVHECSWLAKFQFRPDLFDDIGQFVHRWVEWQILWTTSGDNANEAFLYEDINGTNAPEVVCVDERYTGLYLYDNGLTGTLPREMFLLTSLRNLELQVNVMSGSLPVEIGALSLLNYLSLPSELSGTFPTQIGVLYDLKALSLSNLKMSSPLPSELGQLSLLEYVDIGYGEFTGSVPTELGQLSNMKFLAIYGIDFLTGSIPSELSQMEALAFLQFVKSPLLTGSLPSELGLLTDLMVASFSDTSITGTLPSELGLLTDLQVFAPYSNLISGSIPTEYGNLSNLFLFYGYDNIITGPIPSEMGLLHGVDSVSININLLTSTIPTDIGSMTELTWLNVRNNYLNGTLPVELQTLTKLELFAARDCNLSGSLPSQLGMLTSLQQVYLSSNRFQGSLPVELTSLTDLWLLHVQNNTMTGSLPSEIGGWNSMVELSLQHNFFSGTVPRQLGNLHQLESLDLSNAGFEGVLPTSMGNLTGIKWLSLQSNSFKSTLPLELVMLSNLEGAHFHDNFFTGSVDSFGDAWMDLQVLTLTDTLVTGTIPAQFCDLNAEEGQALFNCSDILCGCDCICA